MSGPGVLVDGAASGADGVHPLDNPVWSALTGPHAPLATAHGRAAAYPAEITPFVGLADARDPAAWADLAALLAPGVRVLLPSVDAVVPAGWEIARELGVQLVDVALATAEEPEAVALGVDDVPEMLALVARTKPGPFLARTVETGRYLGIRRGGRLVAMAGERMRLPGWTEISAVCTDPDHRGAGLATRLVRAVAAGIRARGEVPFLHAAASNTGAVRLYEHLGFRLRGTMTFHLLTRPDDGPAPPG
ncbi:MULTISPECIES: GNAT family N-acetyltransferase [Polymorphospora]|uniref:GNAT family N-acetyltransferase n=1 Tax=Polymorphospora lycopeni TaxID=3140240 RepID=A0ABV5CUR9_9ACTN